MSAVNSTIPGSDTIFSQLTTCYSRLAWQWPWAQVNLRNCLHHLSNNMCWGSAWLVSQRMKSRRTFTSRGNVPFLLASDYQKLRHGAGRWHPKGALDWQWSLRSWTGVMRSQRDPSKPKNILSDFPFRRRLVFHLLTIWRLFSDLFLSVPTTLAAVCCLKWLQD